MKFNAEKIFYSIREVAEMFNVNPSLLRYWEKEFSTINPTKTSKGIRQYKKEDIEEIKLVHYLVKEKGMTLLGAKQKLKENRDKVIHTEEIVSRMKEIRNELWSLKTALEELGKTQTKPKDQSS
ncbi:MAG: MerR family transcriptional regulator [Dysgonamonadaceae bacterium]|jgi:DNA-binding transcriptional MerR regulator|nr:MerR family transcriptional regulator [Dysgonamonadaceae bacterium]